MSWELRSAIRLARLQHAHGKTAKPDQPVSCIYDRFSEGFETLALKNARALIESFARQGKVRPDKRTFRTAGRVVRSDPLFRSRCVSNQSAQCASRAQIRSDDDCVLQELVPGNARQNHARPIMGRPIEPVPTATGAPRAALDRNQWRDGCGDF